LGLLQPGDEVVTMNPVYGGTDFLFEKILPSWGIHVHRVLAGTHAPRDVREKLKGNDRIKVLYLETPANPNLLLTDIRAMADLAREFSTEGRQIKVIVDNTLLGQRFQLPVKSGADIVIYSATKFIGGHSDLVAGVVLTSEELMAPIMNYRTIMGTMSSPFNGWLMSRSLETLSIRNRQQQKNALKLVELLQDHPQVEKVFYPGQSDDPVQNEIFERQCTGSGSMISFRVRGGEREAFQVLDGLEDLKLAVSLGGTESLVQHPKTMTHSDLDQQTQEAALITDNLVRLSVGIEHSDDLISDLKQILDSLK